MTKHREASKMTDEEKARWEVKGWKEKDNCVRAYLKGLAEGRKEKWHSLLEDPNDLPSAQEYEINGNTDHWKWYLVKTDYTNYKSCHYAICARVLMPRYSDGVEEPIWKENSGNDIGDEHIFEWKEL